MYVYVCMFMYVCICKYVSICTYSNGHNEKVSPSLSSSCIYVRTYVCICMYVCVGMFVCMYVCMNECMYVRTQMVTTLNNARTKRLVTFHFSAMFHKLSTGHKSDVL